MDNLHFFVFLFPEFVSKQSTKLAAVRSGESPLPWLLAEEHNVKAPALSIYLFIHLFFLFYSV